MINCVDFGDLILHCVTIFKNLIKLENFTKIILNIFYRRIPRYKFYTKSWLQLLVNDNKNIWWLEMMINQFTVGGQK